MSHRSLRSEVGVYAACERYFGRPRHAVLRSLEPGFRSWLDQFKVLESHRQDCGCKHLGGGGRHYCSGAHMMAELGVQPTSPDASAEHTSVDREETE